MVNILLLGLLIKEYSAVVTPVVDGYHADQYQVKEHKVERENIDVVVKYHQNGQIIPVNSKGEKLTMQITQCI